MPTHTYSSLQGTAPLTLTTTWSLPVFPFVIATRTGDDEVSWEPGTGGSAVLARQRQGEVRVPALRCAVCRGCVPSFFTVRACVRCSLFPSASPCTFFPVTTFFIVERETATTFLRDLYGGSNFLATCVLMQCQIMC